MSDALIRKFCGWESPILTKVIDFLVSQFGSVTELDLSKCILVFSGGRAGRRAQELLALKARELNLVLNPPHITTIGAFPEFFYESKIPVASSIESNLAWVRALQKGDRTKLKLKAGLLP